MYSYAPFNSYTPCAKDLPWLHTYMSISPGPQNVNVIKWCACDRSERLNRCRRLHKWMVYFPDTPNERAVNVGHCAGNSVCRDDQGMGFDCAYLASNPGFPFWVLLNLQDKT